MCSSDLLQDVEEMNDSFPRFLYHFLRGTIPALQKLSPAFGELTGQGLLMDNHPLILKSLWISMFLTDYRPAAAHITVPLLYLLPEKGIYPREAAAYLQEHAKAPVEVVKVPGSSHLAPMEKPHVCARELKRFLENEPRFCATS